MTADRGTVLISGASVAGPVLAYWLRRRGFAPTVVERTPELRIGDGGHAVDLFGPAVDVMERMGIREAVSAARTRTEALSLIRPGHRSVAVDMARLVAGVSDRHIEIMRGDLAQILHTATRDDVEYRFDDSVTGLRDTGTGVEVTFTHAPPQTFDLVVGADGLHSGTRRLVFGEEPTFRHYLGGYLGVFTLPNYLDLDGRMLVYNTVNRTVATYPVRAGGHARALFLLRSARELDHDHRDLDAQRRILRARFGDMGWEVPRLLAELEHADDLYADSISQIRMDTWSKGRVTLVGDAGYSPGPAVGGGTSLATVGAFVLAAELAAADGDHTVAFPSYEHALGEAVRHSRTIGPAVLASLIPSSRTQIWAMTQALRWLPRLPRPIQRKVTAFGGGPAAMLDGVVLRSPGEHRTDASIS